MNKDYWIKAKEGMADVLVKQDEIEAIYSDGWIKTKSGNKYRAAETDKDVLRNMYAVWGMPEVTAVRTDDVDFVKRLFDIAKKIKEGEGNEDNNRN